MWISKWILATVVVAAVGVGAMVRAVMTPVTVQAAPALAADRVFELRTYTAAPGKFENLKARFRDHTLKLFAKHGLNAIGGYYVPAEGPLSENTIIYVLVHESRAAADKNWAAFQADPEWIKAREASVAGGPITTSVTRQWLNPADFSPVK
jgi:hypothetical protein